MAIAVPGILAPEIKGTTVSVINLLRAVFSVALAIADRQSVKYIKKENIDLM